MAHQTGGSTNNFEAITPSDSVNLVNGVTDFIKCGGAGNLSVLTSAGTTRTVLGVLAGEYVPVQCKRINATGTTCTNITGFWLPTPDNG